MGKKIRFGLNMPGKSNIGSIEELQEYFDLASVMQYYFNGKLERWLQDRGHLGQVEQLSKLDSQQIDFKTNLCKIFGVEYIETKKEAIDQKEIEQLVEKRHILRQFTDNESILENAKNVAFNQDDLNVLLNGDEKQQIYLCGEKFNIPLINKNKAYIGINKPQIEILPVTKEELSNLHISFENTQLPEFLKTLTKESEKLKKEKAPENIIEDKIIVIDINQDDGFYIANPLVYQYKDQKIRVMLLDKAIRESFALGTWGLTLVIKRNNEDEYKSVFPVGCGLPLIDSLESMFMRQMRSKIALPENILNLGRVVNKQPIVIYKRYIYALQKDNELDRLDKNPYSGNIVRYDLETEKIEILAKKISAFRIYQDRIIYFVWNGEKGASDCGYDVKQNSLNFSNEVFLKRIKCGYDSVGNIDLKSININNNEICFNRTRMMVGDFLYEEKIPLIDLEGEYNCVNFIDTDVVYKYFIEELVCIYRDKLKNACCKVLNKRGLDLGSDEEWNGYNGRYDNFYSIVAEELYKNILDEKIKISFEIDSRKREVYFEEIKLESLRDNFKKIRGQKIIENNSVFETFFDNDGKCDVIRFLNWCISKGLNVNNNTMVVLKNDIENNI